MVEKQSRLVEDAMKKIVNDLDVGYLRKIQANMHRCAARCCDNTTESMEEVRRCVQNCNQVLSESEQYIQNEFSTSQNRLQRCIMDCNDDVRDKISGNPTDEEMSRHQSDFEKCAIKCVDKHIASLSPMVKKMKEVLSQKQKNSALYYPV